MFYILWGNVILISVICRYVRFIHHILLVTKLYIYSCKDNTLFSTLSIFLFYEVVSRSGISFVVVIKI